MQRNGARYKPEEQPDPQQAIEQKKKELDEEFQRFLKKNSQASTMSTKENRHSVPGVGFKSLLDEVVRDNGHKSQKEAALALKQQQSVVSAQNPGRVGCRLPQSTFASTFNQGFRATNVSSFRETARLTNGFNAAANEKSNYISVGLMKDSEYADIQKEAIEHNLHNVSEEQELTNCYQETLMYMLQCIADDTALIRKRTLELQKEERVLGKQSDQCEALNHSAHFMNISITSKFQIVKNKSKQNQKELEKVVDEAEENLEKERTRVARMKAELAEAIQQSDSLKLAKEQLDRELEKVDRENKNLQRIVDFKVGEYRKEMLQLMDVDVDSPHLGNGLPLPREQKPGKEACQTHTEGVRVEVRGGVRQAGRSAAVLRVSRTAGAQEQREQPEAADREPYREKKAAEETPKRLAGNASHRPRGVGAGRQTEGGQVGCSRRLNRTRGTLSSRKSQRRPQNGRRSRAARLSTE